MSPLQDTKLWLIAHLGLGKDALHIGLIHSVVHRPRRLQATGSVQQGYTPLGGDVLQVTPAHFRVRRGPGDGDPHPDRRCATCNP